MKTFSLLNQKGGTGKTTSAVSLGAVWAEEDRDVLLVDLDPQASLSRWIGTSKPQCARFLKEKIGVSEAAVGTDWEHLDLVPADRSLAGLEDFRAGKLVRRLESLLAAAETVYDVCLVDPPPSTGSLVLTAMLSAEGIIAPVQTGQGALDGLTDTMGLIRQVGGTFEGAFACQVDIRTVNDSRVPELLKDKLGKNAYDTFIRETVQVKEAEAEHIPPPVYAPDATATEDYRNLATEIMTKTTEVAA
ncbi:MAG: ParA family protein [Salinibacter sp.]|uniref:ParA family protein n=1 Tax=Salinibacter sp. TaxID=2065818 RepID=UPI0035D500A5